MHLIVDFTHFLSFFSSPSFPTPSVTSCVVSTFQEACLSCNSSDPNMAIFLLSVHTVSEQTRDRHVLLSNVEVVFPNKNSIEENEKKILFMADHHIDKRIGWQKSLLMNYDTVAGFRDAIYPNFLNCSSSCLITLECKRLDGIRPLHITIFEMQSDLADGDVATFPINRPGNLESYYNLIRNLDQPPSSVVTLEDSKFLSWSCDTVSGALSNKSTILLGFADQLNNLLPPGSLAASSMTF